jgi:hypothetical protein
MNAITLQPDTGSEAPMRRWFWYLLIFTVISLAAPYFANEDSRLYSPGIGTYHEVDGRLQSTTEKIWIDGSTAAELNRGFYLYIGLSFVLVEFVFFAASRLISRLRSKAGSTPRSSPIPARHHPQSRA